MASYIQSYFQASSMPKRLLQYALSRLEILDTEALGLENLDIAWGKNSEFVFRDVGLKLRKLESLLQLPPSFEFSKARVILLRITIPVDIYSSPILVEVDGVECQLRVPSAKSSTIPASPTNHDRKRKRPASKNVRGDQSPTRTRNAGRGEFLETDDLDPTIPTAADLAQSFLQTEPKEEKAELEAAILETQDLAVSTSLSEDDEISTGTGTALSLPAFMTNFLQGVVDRLQVRVHGININLDVDIPNESSQSTPSQTTDPVTVQIKIDSVDIEGVTHEAREGPMEERSGRVHKEGKRLIFLSKLRGVLISEANVFSSLARSSALSSPATTHSDVFEKRSSSKCSSARGSSYRSFDQSSPGRLSSRSELHKPESSTMRGSVTASDSGRFDDASEDGTNSDSSDSAPPADLLVSEMRESVFENSAFFDQVTDSHYAEDEDSMEGSHYSVHLAKGTPTGLGIRSPMSTPKASAHLLPMAGENSSYFASRSSNHRPENPMLYSSALPRRQRPRFSEQRVSQSQPLLSNDLFNPTEDNSIPQEERVPAPQDSADENIDSDEGEASTPIGEDELAQSQIFSHADAESMYMSAISQGSSPSARIPGGWSNSDHGDDVQQAGPASPPFSDSTKEPLDNLEHARHIAPQCPPDSTSVAQSTIELSDSPQHSRTSSSPIPAQTSSQQIPSMSQKSSDASERSNTSSEEYTRMTKQIFDLDQIAIYLPGINPQPEVSLEAPGLAYGSGYGSTMFTTTLDGQNDPSQSIAPDIPGAFSVHETRQPPPPPPPKVSTTPNMAKPVPKSTHDSAIEVNVGQLSAQFDVSVGRLIWRLVCKLQESLKQVSRTSQTTNDESSPPKLDLKLRAEQISVKFLERLEGTLGSGASPMTGEQWANIPEVDVLLRTTFKGLDIATSASQALTKTSVTLEKFRFGYAQENIVSFNAGLQMRTSVRDLAASAGVDLSLNIYQTPDTTRCEVSTLPIHVSIDLQRLDETFSWFGGLSSVLNMGSSMVSNATITSVSPSKPKPRGVRFETPIKPDDKSLAAHNKVDARIGGFILDLLGKDCSIGVETSSVKVVSRDEGIGVSIQKIRLSGPHLRRSNSDPAITAEVTATRIEYLPVPKDVDLDRLLSLITPSKAKYDQDDDILLDTLLRQRKQGAVLRLTVDEFKTRIGKLDELSYLPELGEEISRLSTVAKYLPDDDRPGLLSLITVRRFDTHVDIGRSLGVLQLAAKEIEIAQISLPALIALSVGTISAHRNGSEELLGAATDAELREPRARAPTIMARMIGDEMEPIVKIKLWNLKVEYRVPTLMAILGLGESATTEDLSASLNASVATLTGAARSTIPIISRPAPAAVEPGISKPMTIDVVLRDCILGLNPLGLPSQVLLVLTESHLSAVLPKDQNSNATAEIGKASILIVDNVAHLTSVKQTGRPRRESFDGGSSQVADLCSTGFVSVGYMSSAKAIVQVTNSNGEQSIDVELRDDLFVLESCADSTQTLVAALNGLTPPTPPSRETKYRTKVIPVKDLLASLSGDAFGTAEGDYNFDDDFGLGPVLEEDNAGEDDIGDLEFDSHYLQGGEGIDDYDEARSESNYGNESLASVQITSRDTHDGVLLESFAEQLEEENEPLDFQEDHFGTGSVLEGTAHRWNSAKNTYDRSNAPKVRKSPLKVCVRDVHVIWNLFDGYDWQQTRDTITKAVQDVESKAIEKRARNERRPTFEQDIEDEETVIGDFLFNSIYIGIPANRDPRELAAAINQGLNDDATETESVATTTVSSSPSRQGGSRRTKPKRLRLNRSKHHKITFELRGVCVDLVTFPPSSGETQSSIDVRVHDFEIFDHVPTSTWRKFATYMQDAGEREIGASQIHIEILNVKPIPELAASELVLKATVLPLRLHVDQDALDFITRFFEFKDDSVTKPAAPGDVPFLQRVEVNSVQVKLDFKPKRVDYAGLRSGHTTEFMNFLILDEADMVLRHTIIYGISGFDKMGKCLNDIWMPDIKRNQLPGILAGLAPVRSLVNVGGGLQQLVVVPLHEYKKDGRIVRSISKGAAAFAKTTGTELVKLGAKVAIGMQTVLQGAEGLLGQAGEPVQTGFDEEDSDEESKQISLYANQPVGVFQGLRGGYAGLQRDLLLARDAIIAVPGEVMEEGSAAGVLRAVRKHAPTVILRPAIGVAKAGGQILMGATNSMDPANLKKAGDKYKSH